MLRPDSQPDPLRSGQPASKPADRLQSRLTTTVSSTPARFEAGQIFGKRVSTRFVAGRAKSSVDNTAGRSFSPWRKTLCYVVLKFYLSAIFHCYILLLGWRTKAAHRTLESVRTRVKSGVVVYACVQSNDALNARAGFKAGRRLRSRSAVANRAVTYILQNYIHIIPFSIILGAT